MKIYATLGNDIKVTKDQFDEIMKKQNEGYTVTQALILMGLETVENVIDGLERNRKYAQYDTDKKIEEIKEFGKTLNEEEVEDMDLKIKYRTGRAVRNKIVSGTGTKDKYENKYEGSVVTESGTMSQSEWENAIEKRIVELKEEHIVESLIEYALEECAWIHTREGARNYALDLYASRIWENENWVGYDMFRKKLGIEVETKVEEEVIDMEFTNIESVEVKNKTIRVGARCTIKNDENVYVTGEVLELRQYKNKVTALTWDGEINVQGLYKIIKDVEVKEMKSDIEKIEDKKVECEIVSLNELVKKDMIKIMNHVFNTGYIRKHSNADFGMKVEENMATVVDKNTGTEIVKFEINKKKKYSVVSDVKNVYLENKTVDVVALEVIDYIKRIGKIIKIKVDINDIAFVVEGHNEDKYIELVDVIHETKNTHIKKNELIKELMTKHLDITKKYKQSDVECGDFVNFIKNKNESLTYSGVVERVNTLARTVDIKYKRNNDIIEICTISFDNLTRIKTLTLKEEEKHITKEESVKEQKIINKVKISKSTDRLVEVDDIKLYKIKEIVEKLPKNTKQIDENVVKLNKENTLKMKGDVGIEPIKKMSTNT